MSTLTQDVDGDVSEGQLSLAEAIRLANAFPGEDTITFAPALFGGTIHWRRSATRLYSFQGFDYVITDDVNIVGPGADRLTLGRRMFVINDDDANHLINVSFSGLTISSPFGFETTENTVLSGIKFVARFSNLNFKPTAGGTVHVIDSYFENATIVADGAGSVVIDNSTLVAPDVTSGSFWGNPTAYPAIQSKSGNVTVRNSTLLGRREVSGCSGNQFVIDLTTGGIDGRATVISSIVPYAGAGSTFTNSLVINGDSAGLVQTSVSTTTMIDTTAPSAPVVQAPAALINDSTPTFSGTAEANSVVRIVVDPDSDSSTNNSFILTTTAGSDGNWSVDVSDANALRSGQRASYSATAIDAAGNTSTAQDRLHRHRHDGTRRADVVHSRLGQQSHADPPRHCRTGEHRDGFHSELQLLGHNDRRR